MYDGTRPLTLTDIRESEREAAKRWVEMQDRFLAPLVTNLLQMALKAKRRLAEGEGE